MNSYLVCIVYFFVCVSAQKLQRDLYEGDDCELPHNEKGICVRLSLCPSAIELVQHKQHPKKCGFVRSIPIVCCAKTQVKITRLAEQKCMKFQTPESDSNPAPANKASLPSLSKGSHMQIHENTNGQTPPLQHMPSITNEQKIVPVTETLKNEDDDNFHIFVVGGKDALMREFPHMAALGYTSDKQKLWLCGGSLISEQYVLTAAHCLHSRDYGHLEWVRLGELNLASSIEPSIPQDYKVVNKIAHPLYKIPSVYHDIALVQLDRNIVITSYVKPACLFTQESIPADLQLLATGWGLTNVGGKQSDILQKVDLDIFTEEECDQTFKNIASTRRLKNGILHRQQMCVGGRSQEKDTCQGDSGGPLQIKINDENGERFYVVGVTSFGRSCGISGVPGIYTRVSYYIPWIESILWPNEKY